MAGHLTQPPSTVNRASLAPRPTARPATHSTGASAAPAVFRASAVPKRRPCTEAASHRWLKSAPMTSVGRPKASSASRASAHKAAAKLPPNISVSNALNQGASHNAPPDIAQARHSATNKPARRVGSATRQDGPQRDQPPAPSAVPIKYTASSSAKV